MVTSPRGIKTVRIGLRSTKSTSQQGSDLDQDLDLFSQYTSRQSTQICLLRYQNQGPGKIYCRFPLILDYVNHKIKMASQGTSLQLCLIQSLAG